MSDDLAYWLALTRFRAFGPVRMHKLSRRFSDMRLAFEASVAQLIEAGIEPDVANRFLQERIHIDPQHELEQLEHHHVHAITIKDPEYPPLLKTIFDPPAVLFVRGTLPSPHLKQLAVVGSRKATPYGKRVVARIVEPLAQSGVVIVSGLAHGIDAWAHEAALNVHGVTLAVLGSGVDQDNIYPSQNRALASAILSKGGALLSEFPIGTPPLKQYFPVRNRVIAGLSHGVLVIEGAIQSGSLITAKSALDAGRDVFAVPGSIDAPLSEGPNMLIKQGATLVTEPTDIFGVTVRAQSKDNPYTPESPEEETILRSLSHDAKHIDEIARESHVPVHLVSSTLTVLEMKGVAHHEGGRYYTKAQHVEIGDLLGLRQKIDSP